MLNLLTKLHGWIKVKTTYFKKAIFKIHTIFSKLITETRNKALDKLEEIKSTDAFSKDLTDETVANVYDGFNETLNFSTFLQNVVAMQSFWSKKEMKRMLTGPTYNDDINALGFDTSLVILKKLV